MPSRWVVTTIAAALLTFASLWPQPPAASTELGSSGASMHQRSPAGSGLVPAARAASAAPIGVEEIRRKATRLCTGWGYKSRLHQAKLISGDFTGDGVNDGLAAFSCIPKQDGTYAGYVSYWTNDSSAMSPQGVLFRQAEFVLISTISLEAQRVKVKGVGWDTRVRAEADWRADRWITRWIKVVPTTDW